MLSPDAALSRLDTALAAARAAGADAADAVYLGDGASHVSVRLGALEDIGRAEGEEVGLRVFVGNRSASVSSSDLTPSALAEAASRAVAMARLAPDDPFAGLAPADWLAMGALPDFDIDDPTDISAADLKLRALACEDDARAIGRSFGTTVRRGGGRVVMLGRDGRISSPALAAAAVTAAAVLRQHTHALQRRHELELAQHVALPARAAAATTPTAVAARVRQLRRRRKKRPRVAGGSCAGGHGDEGEVAHGRVHVHALRAAAAAVRLHHGGPREVERLHLERVTRELQLLLRGLLCGGRARRWRRRRRLNVRQRVTRRQQGDHRVA
jgi:hypothetical protein